MNNSGVDGGKESVWHRLFYTLLFLLIFGVLEVIVALAALYSFITRSLLGWNSDSVSQFGAQVGEYLKQIAEYQMRSSDVIPWPGGSWPAVTKQTDE